MIHRIDFEKRYNLLNSTQKFAVDYIEGPLAIIAGPGSGKTEVLAVRIANIIRKTDTPAESVLCLTYTEAANSNMRKRLIDLMGEDGYRVSIYTFHGFCKKIIETYPEYFFKNSFFDVIDEATKVGILENIFKSLDYKDPLSVFHPKEGYIFLSAAKESIATIKESGLTVDEFEEVIKHNKEFFLSSKDEINELFKDRVGKETIPRIEEFICNLKKNDKFVLKHVKSISYILAESLEEAVAGDTKKISEWKRKWTIKKDGKRVLKNFSDIDKIESIVSIYKKYKEKMSVEGYYEFIDMLLGVVIEIEKNEELRDQIREKYLYFLVDEFQDTNGVQMRILSLLTDDKRDKKPNICVVGDDDQAIYRFQGAEISNILELKNNYPTIRMVTLLKNYRSKKEILNVARKVILKGDERLENIIKEVNKNITSQVGCGGEIYFNSFKTKEEEFIFVARSIKRRIKEGLSPENIAVIARTHKTIEDILPFLSYYKIPAYAQRKENIFGKKHIRQIIIIIKFASLLLKNKNDAESLLPEILSYPFWKIERQKIFNISVKSYNERKGWIECMQEDIDFKNVMDFLINLSVDIKDRTLKEAVDIIINSKEASFKEFYFSKEKFDKKKIEYLDFLSSLRKFIKAVEEFNPGKMVMAEDINYFLEIYEKNKIPLLNNDPLVSQEESVSIITAHGTKGKEFDTVFIINCQEREWGIAKGRNKISLPANIPFKKSGENRDDRLRLFYVAITRAKNSLIFSSSENDDSGNKLIPLEFLNIIKAKQRKEVINNKIIESCFLNKYSLPFHKEEKKILLGVVEKYKLSATGFNKFLDVTSGGPQIFLEENILNFPKKKTLPLSYGIAIHNTIMEVYLYLKKEKKLPSEKKLFKFLENYLIKERLTKKDFLKLIKQGKEELSFFYRKEKKSFSENHLIEKNFKNEGCFVGNIGVTGKIDKIIDNNEMIIVSDFKTGKPINDWNIVKNEYEKIKSWRYKNQLIFYKILVETSNQFKGKRNVEYGSLEFLKPTKDNKIKKLFLKIEEEDVDRTKTLIEVVGEKIKNLDFPSTEKYKKNTIKEIISFENDLINKKI